MIKKEKLVGSDITICSGHGCPWKTKCIRYLQEPDRQYQAMFVGIPGKKVDEVFTCDLFWGLPQENIFNYLKEIVTGREKEDDEN
jgi:hypothetical protein